MPPLICSFYLFYAFSQRLYAIPISQLVSSPLTFFAFPPSDLQDKQSSPTPPACLRRATVCRSRRYNITVGLIRPPLLFRMYFLYFFPPPRVALYLKSHIRYHSHPYWSTIQIVDLNLGMQRHFQQLSSFFVFFLCFPMCDGNGSGVYSVTISLVRFPRACAFFLSFFLCGSKKGRCVQHKLGM